MYNIKVKIPTICNFLFVSVIFLSFLGLLGKFLIHFLGYTEIYFLGFLQTTFVNEFDLGSEANITTYFSGLLLLSVSILLWIIAYIKRDNSSPFYRHWFGLSLVFAYISVDEVATLHERTEEPLRQLIEPGGIFHYVWVIPAAVGLLLLGIVYARFLWHLQARWKGLFAISAALYVGGALGVEMVGGWYASKFTKSFTYELISTVEETLEMAGAAFFIYSLLDYLSSHVEGVVIMFQSASDR